MLHRGCSHVLKNKHASGATDKLPVLTESARMHADACVHEKETVRKLKWDFLKKQLRKIAARPHNLITSPLETIPWHDHNNNEHLKYTFKQLEVTYKEPITSAECMCDDPLRAAKWVSLTITGWFPFTLHSQSFQHEKETKASSLGPQLWTHTPAGLRTALEKLHSFNEEGKSRTVRTCHCCIKMKPFVSIGVIKIILIKKQNWDLGQELTSLS